MVLFLNYFVKLRSFDPLIYHISLLQRGLGNALDDIIDYVKFLQLQVKVVFTFMSNFNISCCKCLHMHITSCRSFFF